jgi:hypothetical protein
MIPLKAVLSAINTDDDVEYLSSYLSETFGSTLGHEIHKKDISDDIFEIYFIMMELSDSLTNKLYSSTLVKRATKLCQTSTALFPVYPLLI